MPVKLLLGRAMLLTRPSFTGSWHGQIDTELSAQIVPSYGFFLETL